MVYTKSWRTNVSFQVHSSSPSKDRIRRNSEGVLPATVMLDKIAGDIRARVPLEAVMPTETIVYPTIGKIMGHFPIDTNN